MNIHQKFDQSKTQTENWGYSYYKFNMLGWLYLKIPVEAHHNLLLFPDITEKAYFIVND